MHARALLVVVAVLFGAALLATVAQARHKDARLPVRIFYSSNFEGELEPCG
jgi:hypothetical protein